MGDIKASPLILPSNGGEMPLCNSSSQNVTAGLKEPNLQNKVVENSSSY